MAFSIILHHVGLVMQKGKETRYILLLHWGLFDRILQLTVSIDLFAKTRTVALCMKDPIKPL